MRFDAQRASVERCLSLASRASLEEVELAELQGLVDQLAEADLRVAAKRNAVYCLVGSNLCNYLGSACGSAWRLDLAHNERRVGNMLGALAGVVADFDAHGCAPAVIENGGVLLGSSQPMSAFDAGDLDIMVTPESFPVACRRMEVLGFTARDRRSRPTNRVEFWKQTGGDRAVWLGVCCDPFDRMWVPLHLENRSAVWLMRRVSSKKCPTVKVLHPVDALTLIAIHTSLHSYVRSPGLRLHTDMDRLVRDNDIDWKAFVDEVYRCRGGTRAYVSVCMAAELLGTPCPSFVANALRPSASRARKLARMLSRERVFADGRRKLGPLRSVCLDYLISERGFVDWLINLAVPSETWMREHFDRDRTGRSIWQLHCRRYWKLAVLWRPR